MRSSLSCLLLVVAALLAPAPAAAQHLDARELLTLDGRMPPARAAQTPSTPVRARAAFERGVALADGLQWSEAAEAFEDSYRLLPRADTLRNLGLAHRALGRYVLAIDELRRFLAAEGAGAAVQREVEGLLAEMRSRLATVAVTASVEGATLAFDQVPLRAGEEREVDPGSHLVEAIARGYARAAQTVVISPGQHRRIDLVLEPTGGGGVLTRWWFWTIVGVVAAGAVTAGVVLLSGENAPDCGTLRLCLMPR